jgi:uncharacterized membrane protein YeaQ/YmgE (transglycosylase-associated protein family)
MELLILLGTGLVAAVVATKILKSKSHGLVIDTIIGAFGAYAGATLIALGGVTVPHTLIASLLVGIVSGSVLHFLANRMPVKTF